MSYLSTIVQFFEEIIPNDQVPEKDNYYPGMLIGLRLRNIFLIKSLLSDVEMQSTEEFSLSFSFQKGHLE